MSIRVAINGFGRIGRMTARRLLADKKVQLVAVNDLGDIKMLKHLFKYDSVQGEYDGKVELSDKSLTIDDQVVYFYSSKDPKTLPWKDLDIDIVIESTGVFRTRETAYGHIEAGAKKVIISAPAKSDDVKTIVLGVNDHELTDEDDIISNASCTTNCAAPIVKILQDKWGIENAILTTIHAYTADQRLQDAPHKDFRRARAAAENIIPTSTGAANAVVKLFPALNGKMTGSAIRVPVPGGSLTELTCVMSQEVTRDELNREIERCSIENYPGIIEFSDEPLVSSDIVGKTPSSIFDSQLTFTNGRLIKISSWYDNEYGYSSRLAELTVMMAERALSQVKIGPANSSKEA